jgi:hypothetical protein
LAPPHRLTLGHRLDSTDLQYAIDRGMESIGIPVAADLSDGGGLGSLCNDCAPPLSQLPPVQDGSGATAGNGGCTVSSSAGDHCGGGGGGRRRRRAGPDPWRLLHRWRQAGHDLQGQLQWLRSPGSRRLGEGCGRNPGGGVGLGNDGGIWASSLHARDCIVGPSGGAGELGRSGSNTTIGVRGSNDDGGGGLNAHALGGDLDRGSLGRGSGGLDARDPGGNSGTGIRGMRDRFDESDHDVVGGLGGMDSSGDVVSFGRGGPSNGANLGQQGHRTGRWFQRDPRQRQHERGRSDR